MQNLGTRGNRCVLGPEARPMSAVQRARGYLVPDEVDREIAYSKQDFTGHVKKAAIL